MRTQGLIMAGLVMVAWTLTAQAVPATLRNADNVDGNLSLNEMAFTLPDGWKLVQDGRSGDTDLIGISKGDQYITLYSRPGTVKLDTLYTADAQGAAASNETYGWLNWQTRDTQKAAATRAQKSVYVHGFLTTHHGRSYYGFSRASTAAAAKAGASDLLNSMRITLSSGRSLTGANYTGKKYYLGWGAAMFFDPQDMQNEVTYDVKHTHDIFTKDIGGGYLPTTMFGQAVTGNAIQDAWNKLTGQMTADDMYIQYSSGHGSPSGLEVGVSYSDIRDAILKMPAREIVVLTMACYSGGLVKAVEQSKSQWQDFPQKGRTLFVMSSSSADETSSTGPGTDPDEPAGQAGTAGSAFGHSVWKALIGYADGKLDGVKDGFISLGELRDYAIERTQQIGQHTPQVTGSYSDQLIMNRVPPKALVEALEREGGTSKLTDEQLMRRVQELDRQLGVH